MKEEKEQTVIDKTYMYLENYHKMQKYVDTAVSEVSQVTDADKYNVSAEIAFMQSIRECKAETIILLEHMKKALESLKEDSEEEGEEYKYKAFYMRYIENRTYESIAREMGCGKNSPKKWSREMIEKYSIKLFGAKAIIEKF